MTDPTPAAPSNLPVPITPTSSLSTEAQAAKAELEGWMGNPASPYHRGDGKVSAQEFRQQYADLVRGGARGF